MSSHADASKIFAPVERRLTGGGLRRRCGRPMHGSTGWLAKGGIASTSGRQV